jgi:hypothetical protein
METCCICLNTNPDDINFVTSCCKNKIHSCCIISWFIHKGEIDCPLCRSNCIDVTIDDIITFDLNSSNLLLIENKSLYINNLNKILSTLSGHYVINVTDQRLLSDEQHAPPSRMSKKYIKFIVYFVLYILLVYIIMFFQNK